MNWIPRSPRIAQGVVSAEDQVPAVALMAPVTIVDANDNLETLSEKYSDLKRQILRKNL